MIEDIIISRTRAKDWGDLDHDRILIIVNKKISNYVFECVHAIQRLIMFGKSSSK